MSRFRGKQKWNQIRTTKREIALCFETASFNWSISHQIKSASTFSGVFFSLVGPWFCCTAGHNLMLVKVCMQCMHWSYTVKLICAWEAGSLDHAVGFTRIHTKEYIPKNRALHITIFKPWLGPSIVWVLKYFDFNCLEMNLLSSLIYILASILVVAGGVRVCVCVHAYVRTCMFVCLHAFVCMCLSVCVCGCVWVSVCVCVSIFWFVSCVFLVCIHDDFKK